MGIYELILTRGRNTICTNIIVDILLHDPLLGFAEEILIG